MKETSNLFFYNRNFILNVLFFVFISIILVTRVLLFLTINIDWIDSDQPFMWAGAMDYSKGLFYEPRFYGQNYNTFMEPLFAVPLIWLNVPVYFALPVATHFIFLFPFIFSSSYLFLKGKKEHALLPLIILLCMPTAYDIVNSLPRGFITGLFFTSFFVISFLNPNSIKFIVLNTIFALIGYFVNPNSVIVSAPFLAYLFFYNCKNKKYYLATFICLTLAYPLHLAFDQFYINHPSYVVYGLNYGMGWKYFWINICHLDQAFEHVSFFIEDTCFPLLVVLFFLLFVLFKYYKTAFYSYLIFLSVILFSFFSGKIREGAFWPFYSLSRMYLGIPIVIYLFSSLVSLKIRYFLPALIFVTLTFTAYKLINFKKNIAFHTDERHWVGVHLVSLKAALGSMETYKKTCEKYKVNHLLISNGFWLNTFMAYGGPATYSDFPSTQESNSERRYWVREANKETVFSSFMLITIKYDLDKILTGRQAFEFERLDDYGLYYIKNNTLKNDDFISLLKQIEKR